MKLCSLNEGNIVANFPAFIHAHVTVGIECVQEYGLLHFQVQPKAAFSTDAICAMLDVNWGCFAAGCEFKTWTSDTTGAIEHALAATNSKYQVIDLSGVKNDPDHAETLAEHINLFKQSIREGSYRAQILHSLASSGLDDWFYFTASLVEVIHVIHIQCNELMRQKHLKALSWICSTFFP